MKWGRPTKLARGYATVWRVCLRESEDQQFLPYEDRWYNKRGTARSLASQLKNGHWHKDCEIIVVGYAMMPVESETCFGKETK